MTRSMDLPVRNPAVEEDLALLSQADNYRGWLHSLVRPHLGRRILEIGSGIGNYSAFLLDADRLWLSDHDPGYLDALRRKFSGSPNVSFHHIDLGHPPARDLREMGRSGLDTVLIMNVLEHIPNDGEALEILGRNLAEGGRIVLLVPAIGALYGSLDVAYGHYRRYDRRDAERLARVTGLLIEACRYANLLAAPSWFWLSRVRRVQRLPTQTVRAFDRVIVPVARWVERLIEPPFGSLLLIVLRKPTHAATH